MIDHSPKCAACSATVSSGGGVDWLRSKCLVAVLGTLLCVVVSVQVHADERAAQRNLIELGAYGGLWVAPKSHELYDASTQHRELERPSSTFGLRVGYFPKWYGIEVEAGLAPNESEGSVQRRATVYTFRSHLVAQYPGCIAPFLVVGGGILGVESANRTVGDDIDAAFHWGPGIKFHVHPRWALRLDARQIVSGRRGPGRDNHFEFTGGLSYVMGWVANKDKDGDGVEDDVDACPMQAARTQDGCPVPDSDGDGLADDKDRCPQKAAKTADGCPPDQDGDGVADGDDKCPKRPGKMADGCPGDGDGDGIADDRDKCPQVAAPTTDGCPPPDPDGDGVTGEADKCPDKAETRNGFQDSDGCPDELPKAIKRFTGAIRGINFSVNSAVIYRGSYRVLNQAVAVLNEYPELKLRIRGHSDSQGNADYNRDLSQRRAEAVRQYLISKGIADARLTSEGVGPDEPVADNKTSSGRRANRRIEFVIGNDAPAKPAAVPTGAKPSSANP